MLESIGKKLAKTRLEKGLTVDDAAHATKLRPEKILALEHDDYSRFPSNAYVKGFLQIYGRYLGVDVGPAVRSLENPSPVSVYEYQYLNQEPPPRRTESTHEHPPHRFQAGRPSLMPLIVFVLLCAAIGTGGYIYLNAKRLGPLTPPPQEKPVPAAPAPQNAAPAAPTASQPAGTDAAALAAAAPGSDSAAAAPEPDPATLTPPEPVINEVLLEPVRKTWVKVWKDGPSSAPIFEDYLYTNAPPLRLVGARFYIEVRDANAVTIRKNGAPVAYQSPGLTIQ